MTIKRLVERMKIRNGQRFIKASIGPAGHVRMLSVTFSGGKSGEHTIYVRDDAKGRERITAHWTGYLQNNDMLPKVGGRVFFRAGISRSERVLAVRKNGLAVLVEIHYKHGGTGAKRWIEVSKLG